MTFLNNGEVFSDLDIKGWLVGWLVGKVTFKDRFFFNFEKGHGFESPAIFVCEFFFGKNFQWRGDVVAIFFPRPNLKGRRVKPSFS